MISRKKRGEVTECAKVLLMDIGSRQICIVENKRKIDRNINDAARYCDLIDHVALFGSSVQERYRDSSDIDIVIFGNQPRLCALTSPK